MEAKQEEKKEPSKHLSWEEFLAANDKYLSQRSPRESDKSDKSRLANGNKRGPHDNGKR